MKRYIKVECVSENKYKIVKQTHRGSDFTPEGAYFISSKGIKFASEAYPQVVTDDIVCFRGHSETQDASPLLFDSDIGTFNFLSAVKEYNKCYGEPYSGINCECNRAIVCKECMEHLEEVLNF